MTSPDILDVVPEHVVDPIRRAPWPARIGTAFGDGLLSLLLNLAVVGGLAGIGWPRAPAQAPQAVSVELVDHMPGVKGSGDAGGSATSSSSHDPGGTPKKGAEPSPAPAEPHAPAQPEAAQASKPPDVAPQQAAAAPPPPEPSAAPPDKPAAPTPAPASNPQAVPPPPEHPDAITKPRLVEAPLPPRPAETQADARQQPVAAPQPSPDKPPTAGPPPPVPKVVASDRADETVQDVMPPKPKPAAPTVEQQRQAANTATLAAILPFGASIASDPFRAQASAQGQALSDAYRGAVYGNFSSKAADLQEDARARHLRGTVVVAFSVDEQGRLLNSAVAVSSGQPDLDQMGLEMIRRGAPYPPPPSGAQRSFSPALSFGGGE